jgi:hypothetical protein
LNAVVSFGPRFAFGPRSTCEGRFTSKEIGTGVVCASNVSLVRDVIGSAI